MNITCEKTELMANVAEIASKADDLCVVDWSRKMFAYARREACGKCVLCREGTRQVEKIITDITEGRGEAGDLELLRELSCLIKENASCEMARTAAGYLLVALDNYLDEWEMHIKRKRCPALTCKKYISVHILPESCQGCQGCLAGCPEGAIAGSAGMIHVIDQEKCSRCGACLEACKYGAVQKAGAIKPKTPVAPVPVGSFESGTGKRRRRG